MSSTRHLLALSACAFALFSCEIEGPSVQSYPVTVRIASDDGEPLANVDVLLDRALAGRSLADGALALHAQGTEGAQVQISASCPKGTRLVGGPSSLRLRTLGGGAPPEVDLVCERDKRMAALIVSAPGHVDLPVLVHDREVARTDATGTAHAILEGTPATPLRVVLDTSAHPRVIPQSPHFDIKIERRDDIFVFAPELTERAPPPKPKRRAKPKPPPVIRPVRLR